jgi:hypothetical protein
MNALPLSVVLYLPFLSFSALPRISTPPIPHPAMCNFSLSQLIQGNEEQNGVMSVTNLRRPANSPSN